MNWRYQLVGERSGEDVTWSMYEVFLEDGYLTRWGEDPIAPQGDTVSELSRDLANMLLDAHRWKPVMIEDLRVGMEFERALTADQNDDLVRRLDELTIGS